MDNKANLVLEFNKIKDRLKTYAITYIGRQLIDELAPSSKELEITASQNETKEATSYILRQHEIPISPISDISNLLNKLNIGGILNILELIKITDVLRISRTLKSSFSNGAVEPDDFPVLKELFESLYQNKNVEDEISRCIKTEDELEDRASQELYRIRKEIRESETKVKDKLNSLLHTKSKYLQEAIITLRDDRYVLPVKAEYKNEIPGLVHDQSSTGSTIFIEPTSIFNINNEIKELKLKEQLEIQRILSLLSQMLMPIANNISTSIDIIGKLDFAFAKGKYALAIDAISPEFNKKCVNMKKARHPLIDENEVIPIDIWFGDSFNSLIITGPNTGGKTVTLKTVGLLTIMAQSGLFIPAKSGTTLRIFENIYTDIGDEQSIEQSLSTFSSHLTNIVSILSKATNNDLVLIDEIGSGTDPIEGAAIAMAILEYLHSKDITTIATTHYSELKSFAINTEGVQNASCEFDIETLRPTYRLLIGIPGKSNAFAISKKLGLSNEILDRATEFLKEDSIKFEDVLSDMETNRIKAQEERELSKKLLKDTESMKVKIDSEIEKLEKQKRDIIANAKKEARDILMDAKEEADDIIKELTSIERKQSKDSYKLAEEKRVKLKNSINEIQNDLLSPSSTKSTNSIKPNEIVENMEVYVPYLDSNATILKLPDKNDEVLIQSGIVKLKIHISKLEKIKDKSTQNNKTTPSKMINKSRDLSTELQLIGMTVDEAIPTLEKYLDDVYLSNVGMVRIVHGKGTGTLKKAVHDYLRKNPNVKSFRLGLYGEGDTGVTVVEMK